MSYTSNASSKFGWNTSQNNRSIRTLLPTVEAELKELVETMKSIKEETERVEGLKKPKKRTVGHLSQRIRRFWFEVRDAKKKEGWLDKEDGEAYDEFFDEYIQRINDLFDAVGLESYDFENPPDENANAEN